MNMGIGILSLVFVISLFFMVTEVVSYLDTYYPKEDSFLYSLQQQDYARMVDMMYQNQALDVKSSTIYEECYAVAKYYEAAGYYKAYMLSGNQDLAYKKKEIMEQQRSFMGDLFYAAEDIDSVLGIKY